MASRRPASKPRARRPSRAGIPYKKSEETRAHLLVTAIDLIARRGLAGASFTELAEAAGTSKGGIAYYFESKEDLLVGVLGRCCEIMEGRVREAFMTDAPPLERVHRALAEMWRHRRDGVAEMRVLTELSVHARQNATLRRALAAELTRARQQMIDVGLANLSVLGIRPKVDAALVPRLIIGTLDGLALQNELTPFTEAEETELLRALELTVLGLFSG